MNKKISNESFQPVSRGLLEHYRKMSDAQVKLYMFCLLKAKALGKNSGSLFCFAAEMANDLNWIRKKFYEVLKSLDQYLEIKYSNNRHYQIEIRIKNYKSVGHFYSNKSAYGTSDSKSDSNVTVVGTVGLQYGDSNLCNSAKNNNLQTPNNIKNKEYNNIGKRQSIFKNSLLPFIEKYGQEMITGFYEYWSEGNRSKTKMKYEMESTWDLQRRLNRWEKNSHKFGQNNKPMGCTL